MSFRHLAISALLTLLAWTPAGAAGIEALFRVEDDIGFRQIVPTEDGTISWSPDRRHFALVMARGDVATNTNVYELLVYAADDLKSWGNGSHAKTLDRVATADNIAGILLVRWLNAHELTYLRNVGEGPTRLAKVSVSGARGIIAEHATSITAYVISQDQRTAVISALKPRTSMEEVSRGFVAGPRSKLELYGQGLRFPPFNERDYHVVDLASGRSRPLPTVPSHLAFLNFLQPGMSISPDGKWAVLLSDRQDDLAQMYSPAMFHPRYLLVDVEAASRGAANAWTDLEVGGDDRRGFVGIRVAWAPDGSAAFIARRQSWNPGTPEPSTLTAVDLSSRRATLVGALPNGTTAERLTAASAGSVTLRARGVDYRFERGERGWTMTQGPTPAPAAAADEPTVRVRQDLNVPPDLVALWHGREFPISDFNPDLRRFDLGNAEEFRWRADDGREWAGAIVKPHGFVAGRRYPLVVQTHGYAPHSFLLNGPRTIMTSGYSARALAARGMLVVQVPDNFERSGTALEIPDNARVINGAVQALVRGGMADPERIGIHGSSRSGYYVQNALFSCDFRVVAASVAEGNNISREEYTGSFGYHGRSNMDAVERTYDLPPLFGGASAALWAERDPTNHLDRVTSALLVQAYANGLGGWWDTYVLLRRNARPVEYVYYPDSAHVPQKPLERLSAQGSLVDWYDFWLQGREDPDPSKAAQYHRWHRLREWREKVLDAARQTPDRCGRDESKSPADRP